MSMTPQDLKYSKDHEWVRVSGTQATIGITSYAQTQLGDIVFIDLAKNGESVEEGEPAGTIESVKAVAEVYIPLKGRIIEINAAVNEEPELVNSDPYGEGWLIKLQIADSNQLKDLMSADQYDQYITEQE
jgi:glycine cleavage system H protein